MLHAPPGLPLDGRRSSATRSATLLAALGGVIVASALAGCVTTDRPVPVSAVPADFHQRHPVVLANQPTFLDVFPVGGDGRLDHRSLHELQAFAQDYRQNGQGPVQMQAPDNPPDRLTMERTILATRQALAAAGLRTPVELHVYPVSDPRLASPLHLSFVKLQARLASRCGDWPDDLNSGANLNGWDNRTYYNFGCATAKTLAAQLDDPRDLLGPRAEDPTDVQLRTRAIGLLRQGKDPSTGWIFTAPINPVGDN